MKDTGIIKTLDSKYRLNIPKQIYHHVGLNTGDTIEIEKKDDLIVIHKCENFWNAVITKKVQNNGTIYFPIPIIKSIFSESEICSFGIYTNANQIVLKPLFSDAKTESNKLVLLASQNPTLEIVPYAMVNKANEKVIAEIGKSYIDKIYNRNGEYIKYSSDIEEVKELLYRLGYKINLREEKLFETYNSLPWQKVIILNVDC